MVELGAHDGAEPVALKAIAEAEELPLSYLEHVVADLKRAGLVVSTRGAYGGYRLPRAPEGIAMDEGGPAPQGTNAPMGCFVNLPTARVLLSHEGAARPGCSTLPPSML